MFGALYAMLGGDLEELPRRRSGIRSAAPEARGVGDFLAEEDEPVRPAWLQRGELPGQPVNIVQQEEGPSVADELHQLAKPLTPTSPRR